MSMVAVVGPTAQRNSCQHTAGGQAFEKGAAVELHAVLAEPQEGIAYTPCSAYQCT